MSKVVDWNRTFKPIASPLTKASQKMGSSGNMKEDFKKSYQMLMEQEAAQETLKKAFPAMSAVLLNRMIEKRPLKVMRPLPYTTESLSGNEEDDGFYSSGGAGENVAFKSITKVIPVGTELTFITLEKSMNQLWFKTDKGEEVGIYLEEQSRLMTQTDIYEVVAKAMSEE